MLVREINDDDLIEVTNWLATRNWPITPSKNSIPELGFVAELGGQKVAAAYVYMTNADLAIISWVATPPDNTYDGMQGIKAIVEYVQSLKAVNAIMFMVSSEKLASFISKSMGGTKPKTCYNTCIIRSD